MLQIIRGNIVDLPINSSLSYYWCSGFMISGFLVIQIISGIILSLLYVADVNLSFPCIMELTNDSLFSWCVRYVHIWSVSFIFIVFSVHMGRALYYSSYTKVPVWNVGFILYLIMMVEAFLGYILPWHQMSYWAATVLTSVVQSIPFIGLKLYNFIVGGFSVTNVTLMRVFAAHVVLAFVIIGLSVVHLFYLHKTGSNNALFAPTGYTDAVYFHSYYTNKDFYCLMLLYFLCLFFIFYTPDLVLDAEAYLHADPLVTPASIKPEWYFLLYYAMLRSVSSKIGGLILVIVFLGVLWIPTSNYACCYFLSRQILFWLIVVLIILLSYLGGCHPEPPYVFISQLGSLLIVLALISYKFFWNFKSGF
uniref:Cytochrome b n=1 Tax=Benedenia seriolae TaxID=160838 RepID=A0A499VS21_BENSE|nr:cytochrome b [Benedenia seriolae]BBJ70615.1 cytochrome b [Benedenia seriolae]BBJ70627.1 cytochrome b [Benedenia seriolae]BBJ70639.1 cytochrome b [Benedenia seriolae]BBJ70651.1 cytochrome b [Benedenia seriolae]